MYYKTNKSFQLDGVRTLGEFPGKKRISKTIPNQSMTARELIIRFASGLPLDGAKVPIYEGDEETPDWTTTRTRFKQSEREDRRTKRHQQEQQRGWILRGVQK